MNNKERQIIVDAYTQHLENGFKSDIAGAYNDIKDLFKELSELDEKLKKDLESAQEDWERY